MIDGISALSIDTSAWTDPAQRAALDSLLTQITGQVNNLIASLGSTIRTDATGVATAPYAGKIGAGDKDWNIVGVTPGWAWNPNWSQIAGIEPTQIRKLPTGQYEVVISAQTTNAIDNTAAFNIPASAKCRPAADRFANLADFTTGTILCVCRVLSNGDVKPNAGGLASKQFVGSFTFSAEQ